QVPIEVHAFHVDPGGAPRLVRRDRTTSDIWNVAGSAGGYLPSGLQAAHGVLVWYDSTGLYAAPAEGGPPTLLMKELPGDPRLREAVLVFWDRNAGKHLRASLTCGAATAMTLAPLTPPSEPKAADLERPWT